MVGQVINPMGRLADELNLTLIELDADAHLKRLCWAGRMSP